MEDEIQIKEESIDNYGFKKESQMHMPESLNHIKTESYGPVFEDSQSQRIVCLIKTEAVESTLKEEAAADAETEPDGYYLAEIKSEIKLEVDPLRIFSTDSRIGETSIGNNANETLQEQKTTDGLVNQRFALYQCHICRYRTAKLSNFELHNTIHTPFSCHHCKYRAATKIDIRAHLRIHAGEKTYKCPSCDYFTSPVCKLEIHELYHGREKKFVCKHCNYSSSLRLKLKQHVLMKHTI